MKNFCEDLLFFFFFWRSPEKFLCRPFFFWRALALVSLVLGLGLEHSCPWPREYLSSERLSLALASDFFCVLGLGLGLEPCVLNSTSAMHATKTGKGAFCSSLFFQNSEHPRIGYFGYKKLSFDRLNVFFLTPTKRFW